ncbi:hypothetical protein MN608_10933 [Microdochium nivale]|nr:hypothetical protein MN608_10933 [Microdochium nivale]
MRISAIIIAGILPLLASSAPIPHPDEVAPMQSSTTATISGEEVSMMVKTPLWTIEAMQRICDKADTQCRWSFRINDKLSAPVPCSFTVSQKPPGGRGSGSGSTVAPPASHTDGAGFACGVYRVGEGWDGSFGPGNGFATLSVVNAKTKNVIWPGYTDKQLASGRAVAPNQSYAPVRLP